MNIRSKLLAVLCVIALLATAIPMILVSASTSSMNGLYTGTNCTEGANSVTVGNNGIFTQSTFTKFSEGEEATLTVSLDTFGSTWNENGIYIVVSPTQEVTPWTDRADNTFAFAFQNKDDVMQGAVYRYGATSDTRKSDWATASLDGDITITVKKVDGKTILCLNESQWNGGYEYIEGFTIPDGYLSIATTAGSKVTVKNVLYTATNCTENVDGSLSVGNNGSYALSDFTRFSEGEEASITIAVEEMGNAWNENGFYIVVSPKVNAHPLNTVDTFAIAFNNPGAQYEKINGIIYRYDEVNSTNYADWASASLDGDITITVKKVGDKTVLYLNDSQWDAGYNVIEGFTIPDGYLSVVTTAGCKLTVNPAVTVDVFTHGTAGILNTLVDNNQGLRFNYTLTTTATDAGETVTVNGSTYTVENIGMLVSKNPTASMIVGMNGVKQGMLKTARKIERNGDQITYTFSILIKNIGQANKSTDIYARPYLACADGTILYGVTQVTNVYEMYNALGGASAFSDEVVQWMA